MQNNNHAALTSLSHGFSASPAPLDLGADRGWVEQALRTALEDSTDALETPTTLADAMSYALLGGGARLRPQLLRAVAFSLSCRDMAKIAPAAAAIEFLHAASLVHDDLPCFDDAELRRGRPALHKVYGEAIAVLVGDGLIVEAFGVVARAPGMPAETIAALTRVLAQGVGTVRGVIAGQAWESEEKIDLPRYHRQKTGALFGAAAACGALVAGGDAARFFTWGEQFGRAYQIFDDLQDVLLSASTTGKTSGRDSALGRPNVVHGSGVMAAQRQLREIFADAKSSIDDLGGAAILRSFVHQVSSALEQRLRYAPRA